MSLYVKDEICQTEDMRKMFVGNVKLDATQEELKGFLEEQIGEGCIAECALIPPKEKGGKQSKYKMGFVTFTDSDMPDEMFLLRDKLEFKGVKLDVKRAVPKNDTSPGAHEKSKKLFIANLPKNADEFKEDELLAYFTERHDPKYGSIDRVQLIKEKDANGQPTDKNKGFGFIMVTSEDFADKLSIQHRNFMFKNRKIEVKKSVPTDGGFGGGFGGRGGGRGGPRGGRGGPRGGARGGRGGGGWDQGGYGGGWDQGWGDQGWGDQGYYQADSSYDGAYGGGQGYGGGYGGGQGYGGGYSQGGYGSGGGFGGGRGRGRGGRGGRGGY